MGDRVGDIDGEGVGESVGTEIGANVLTHFISTWNEVIFASVTSGIDECVQPNDEYGGCKVFDGCDKIPSFSPFIIHRNPSNRIFLSNSICGTTHIGRP